MRFEGIIKTWNDDRGFGFIEPSQGGQDVFFHIKAFPGWPGAIIAQQVLRHKSTKASFRSSFWATVAVNIAAFVLLCSPLLHLLRGAP